MKRISLCTPVWRRHEMTRLMFKERVKTFAAARELGVECECVVIGDEPELRYLAEECGFVWIWAPNVLGRKYNDGHEWAVAHGFDVSFHVNSDQVFDPRLLVELANAPQDSITLTQWLTAVNETGRKAISAQNPTWAMTAYPTSLLRLNPRPCAEDLMSGCDRSTFEGVVAAAEADARIEGERVWKVVGEDINWVHVGPLETIQFESGNQLTPWKRWILVAAATGTGEKPVPWNAIAQQHGPTFVKEMREFYGA